MTREPSSPLAPRTQRIRIAWIVAIAADLLQVVLFPSFVEGALSPVNDALDLVVAALLAFLLGWHWAFLPTALAEIVPMVNLVPTWSAAVWIATRKLSAGREAAVDPPALPAKSA